MIRGKAATLSERLERNSIPEPNSGCILWLGAVDKWGYGRIGRREFGYSSLVHRLSYQHSRGLIPSGMLVCHRCDVPSCINPAHLFLGTHADNMADMARKGRVRQGIRN